jgi:hypothetical protein
LGVDVWDLAFDEANIAEMHRHGVSPRQAFEVLEGEPEVLSNYARGGAPKLLVGPDNGGTFVTLPIDPTTEYAAWRPRTAYRSKSRDIARYRKMRPETQ